MGVLGGRLGYYILKRISVNGETGYMDGSVYASKSKIERLFGTDFWCEIQGKVVVDFGCGAGSEAVDIAKHGARRVIGIDIQERLLSEARMLAEIHGLTNCLFISKQPTERADLIVAIDSFEHFDDPATILRTMRGLLKSDGCIFAAFGPTWYHPLGGHLFSVFPWAHLIFTEKALIRWRSDFKSDGATRFREVESGLNQMTIRRFEKIVEKSPFKFAQFEALPIRKLKKMANQLTREFTSAIVRCKMVPR